MVICILNFFSYLLILLSLPKQSFFSWGERDRRKICSPCVFVTLTYEHNVEIEDSWKEVGKDFNRWITRLRKKIWQN